MALLFPVTHDLSDRVIAAAISVHRQLGPGLLESAYQRCLEMELRARGVSFATEVALHVEYKGGIVYDAYRIDLLIEDQLVVELKSVEKLLPLHTSQVITYLKLGGFKAGLLINFNVPVLKDGLKRILH
ncbi:MAG TPA: GxxExxY protein [Gemmatimonadales bacterium]|nr:GxxExxY protein [Gemmatimonadales bacterium]